MGSSCFTTMRFRTLFFICATLIDATMGSYECDSFSSGSLCSLSPIDNILGLIPNMEDEMKCQAECYQTSECNFFTFEMFIDGTSSCLLFKDCDPATVNSCQEEAECSFSVIGPATPNIGGACCSDFFNAACPMDYLISEEYGVNDEQTCQIYCRANAECNYYSLINDVCFLYSDCADPSNCEICFSGPSFPYKSECDATESTTTTLVSTTTPSSQEVPALFVGPDSSHESEIILLPPQSSNCSTPDFPVADIYDYVMFSSTTGVQLCGGEDWSTVYSDCYELKVGGKNWEKQTPMLKKRYGASQAKFGDTIYISGGSDGDSVLKSTEIRSEDGSWELSVELPEPTAWHCIVTISETKIILIGGQNGDYKALTT